LLVLALSSSSILLYQFLQPAIGGRGGLWKHLAIHGVSTKLLWKGFSEIRLQRTQKDRRFPRARGNRMVISPRRESKFRRLEPIKNKRQKEKAKMEFEKSNTE
jgi:hypothetical protein